MPQQIVALMSSERWSYDCVLLFYTTTHFMQGQWNLSYKTIGHTLKIGDLMLNFVLFRNSVPFRLFENYVHWKAYQKKKKRHRERERGKKRRRFQADEGREGKKKKEVNRSVCYVGPDIFGTVVFYQACVFHTKQ